MDLRLFLAVIGRFKRMVIGGTIVVVFLAIMSYGTPGLSHGKPTVIPRGSETWESDAQLIISQAGFPYGRAVQQFASPQKGVPPTVVGDPGQLAGLAPVYSALANGNAIQAEVRGTGKNLIRGLVLGSEVIDQATGQDLPFVNITATAATGRDAYVLAQRTMHALQSWVTQQQAATQTEPAQRIVLEVVKSGAPPKLVAKPKLTTPLLVGMAGIVALIALALIRENLHPETAARLGRLPAPDIYDGRPNQHGFDRALAAVGGTGYPSAQTRGPRAPGNGYGAEIPDGRTADLGGTDAPNGRQTPDAANASPGAGGALMGRLLMPDGRSLRRRQ